MQSKNVTNSIKKKEKRKRFSHKKTESRTERKKKRESQGEQRREYLKKRKTLSGNVQDIKRYFINDLEEDNTIEPDSIDLVS